MIETANRPDRADRSLVVAIVTIALIPAVMAITTWRPDGSISNALYYWRLFAPPVLAVEALAVVIAITSGFRPHETIKSLPRWMLLLLIGLVLIDFGTALTAGNSSVALKRSAITWLHLVFGFSLAHLAVRSRTARYKTIWWTLGGGSLLYLLLLAIYVAAIHDPARFDWVMFGLGVVQFRHIGFYAMIGVALGLGLAGTQSRTAPWLAATALAMLCATEFFWTGSRSPIAALLIVPPISAALLPALRNWRFATSWAATLIGAALLSLLHHPPSPHFGMFRAVQISAQADPNAVSSGRFEMWRSSIETALHRPFFGYGEGQFVDVAPVSQGIYQHPHNILLQVLVQWGLVGIALFVPLALAVWLRIIGAARQPDNAIVPGAFAVNMLAFYSLLDGVFYFVYPVMIWTALVALCLAATVKKAH